MLTFFFPFLRVKESLGSQFSGIDFIVFNWHAIILILIVFLVMFRKLFVYSFRVLVTSICTAVVCGIYLYSYIDNSTSGYEFWAMWMLIFALSGLIGICFLLSLFIDLLNFSERKSQFSFGQLEKGLLLFSALPIIYIIVAIILY